MSVKNNKDGPEKTDPQTTFISVTLQQEELANVINSALKDDFRTSITKKRIKGEQSDLYILDLPSYLINEHHLNKLRESVASETVPMILLYKDRDQLMERPDIWNLADEVLYAGDISPDFLKSRVRYLLNKAQLFGRFCQENEDLYQQKERFRLVTENSTDIIASHSTDGTYKFVSPSVYKILGYTPQELVGVNAYETIHPDDRKEIEEKHRHLLTNGQTIQFTYRKRRKNGEYIWMESSSQPVFNEHSGELIEILSNSRNVSRRVEIEQELLEEKEFLNFAVNHMPGIFYLLDDELNYIFWNKNLEQELGYAPREIETLHPMNFFREEDRSFVQDKIREVLEKGSSEMEVDIITKEGKPVNYYLTAARLERNGKAYIIGSGVDITLRNQAILESEKQKKLLDAIINQSDAVIYVKDQEGTFRLVNDRFLKLFNLDENAIIGKKDSDIIGEFRAKTIRENDLNVLESGEIIEFEEEIPVGDQFRTFISIKYPLKNVPGFENCICGISSDVTERKELLFDLGERIKEQACLHKISKLINESSSVADLLSKAVECLPAGWQYPDITEAAITYGEKVYTTSNYVQSEHRLYEIRKDVEGKSLSVEVIYTEARGKKEGKLFLEEELALINSIADSLSAQIGKIIAHNKLLESEQRWENLVQNDPDLIMILQDMKIKFLNKAGAAMYGADSPDELIGKPMFDLVDVEENDKALIRLQKVLSGEKVDPMIHRVTRINGHERYLKVQSIPTTYNGRKAVQIVGSDMTDRVQYEQKLQQSLREKKVLLQEIHHRVKNNLALISGLLQIQMFDTNDEHLKNLLTNSVTRIKSVALIHEKLYQVDSFSDIDIKYYLDDLIQLIQESVGEKKNVCIEVDSDSLILNLNQAIPCALIINELITNALVHAFGENDNGYINIRFFENDRKVEVTVEDNGKGLPKGFNSEGKHYMGYTIINTLVSQLYGTLEIDGEKGTKVSFTFPLDKVEKGSKGNKLDIDS